MLYANEEAVVQSVLADADSAAVIVAGYGALHLYGAFQRIVGFCPWRRLAFAIAASDRLIVVVSDPTDAADAAAARPECEVRLAERSVFPEELAGALVHMGVGDARVGVLGLAGAFPAMDYSRLQDLVPTVSFADAWACFERATAVKADHDIAQLKVSAGIVEAGLLSMREVILVGNTHREVTAEIERVVNRLGATESLVMAGIGPDFASRSRHDVINAGDLLTVYVEVAGPTGYWVEAAVMVAVGGLSDGLVRIAEVGGAALKSAKASLVTGADGKEIAGAVLREVGSTGFEANPNCGHGVGLDDRDLPRVSPSGTSIQKGMVVALHPQVRDRHNTHGVSAGNTYHVTDGGAVPLVGIDLTGVWAIA